jgi:conjugal transfer ATP-binding protein TraC
MNAVAQKTPQVVSDGFGKRLRNLVFGDPKTRPAAKPIISHPRDLGNGSTLAEFLPYEQYDQENGLFFNTDSVGFVFEVLPQTGADEQMEERLKTLFNPMPPDTCFQWVLYGGPMTFEKMDRFIELREIAQDKGIADPFFMEMAKRRSEYFRDSKGGSLFANRNFFVRDFRLLLSVTRSGRRDAQFIQDTLHLRDALEATLASSQLPAWKLDAEAFVNFMAPLTDPRLMFKKGIPEYRHYDDGRELRAHMGSVGMPVNVSERGITWGFENDPQLTQARVFVVNRYPKDKQLWGMSNIIGSYLDDTLQYPCPFLISQSVRTTEKAKVEQAANVKTLRSHQNAQSKMASHQPELIEIHDENKFLQTHLENGGHLVEMFHSIITFGAPDQQHRIEATVRNIWGAESFGVTDCEGIAFPLYIASLPMTFTPTVAQQLREKAKVVTRKTDQNAVSTAPILAEWNGSGDPVLWYLGKRGTPTGLDFYSNSQGNYNFLATGVSGSGKSVFMNDVINAYASTGATVRIIDIGRAYENTIKMAGGTFMRFERGNMPKLNPFTWIGADPTNSFEDEMQILKPLIARMASPDVPLDTFRSSLLERAITEVFNDYGSESEVDLVAQRLLSIKNENEGVERVAFELAQQLFPFTKKGQYGDIFNGPANLRFNGQIVGLELEDLANAPELQRVVLFAVTARVTHEMYLADRSQKKLFVMDEAWQLLGSDIDTANFIERGFRRARKYEGIFGLGTQGLHELFKSPAGLAAYANADWKIYGRQDSDSLESLIREGKVSFSPAILKMLRSLQKVDGQFSEWLIQSPMGSSVVRFVADPWFLTMASSKGPVFERVKYLIDTGMDRAAAITQVTQENRNHVQ